MARLAHVVHQPRHVRLEALGRLGGHLDAALQDADRELRVRGGREPQAERVVRLAHGQALDDLVELVEPRHHQVAVGKEHPVALLDAGVDEADGVRRLALAERDRREGHAWVGVGVGAMRQLEQWDIGAMGQLGQLGQCGIEAMGNWVNGTIGQLGQWGNWGNGAIGKLGHWGNWGIGAIGVGVRAAW